MNGSRDARPVGGKERKSAIGADVVSVQHSPNVLIKSYVVERSSAMSGLATVEGVIDISWKIPRPVRDVWVHLKDSNSWQNRYGYFWDGIVGDEEGNIVHMSDRTNHYGGKIPYLIRKVIPERLIYLESPPAPMIGKNGLWSGHNIASLGERNGETLITFYMEHTWQSQEETAEQLRAIVQGAVDAAVKFWREFFIPDLEELTRKSPGRHA